MLKGFKRELELEGKSISTINGYSRNIKQYFDWYSKTYNKEFNRLYRVNVLDFISHLKNGELNPKTINHKISSLIKFNEFLVEEGIQDDMVVSKKDMLKIQQSIANPTDVTIEEVEGFRQTILEQEGLRNYTIVTILSYAGLRISECLNLKMNDVNIKDRTILVKDGKGNKYRVVYMSSKVENALNEYLEEVQEGQEYLFVSNRGNKLDRTVINKMFNKYSDRITPHSLRHFFCTRALENGLEIHEVANQAGHSNIYTTLQYTNPSIEEMKKKMSRL